MVVSARRAGIFAGALAALYLVALYSVRTVPDWAIALSGGPTGLARWGGLEVEYQPPAGARAEDIARLLAMRGARFHRTGERFVVEIEGITEDEADDVLAMMVAGGLEFR